MAKLSAKRYLWLVLFLIPGVFLYFGVNSALYRYDIRSEGVEMQAVVEDYRIETYSCKNSDGHRSTCRRIAYDLILDLNGDKVRRPLLEGNFDPDDIWHTPDMISPDDYPRGATMEVLVRPDLGYLVSINNFWQAYMLPIILLGFGAFWLIGMSVIVPSIIKDG